MTRESKEKIVFPFLKWAGGKRWLLQHMGGLIPAKYDRYIEPFLGSGAVFFHLKPQTSILSDVNPELVNTYRVIKEHWKSVHLRLKKYHASHSKDFYYNIRDTDFEDDIDRAVRFIYLNRTCWNGLYRVNLDGHFNVPLGTKTSVVLDTDNFYGVSQILKNSKIIHSDFERVIDMAEKEDFLFVDPPYTVKHNFNGFVKYNEQYFSWEDQVRLRDSIKKAKKRGAKVCVTNADHESVRSLYKGIGKTHTLSRASVMAAEPERRGRYQELIIRCYE